MLYQAIKAAITFLCFFVVFSSYAQITKSFSISENSSNVDLAFYEKSLAAANLEKYRLEDHRRILIFNDGVKVALYSRHELRTRYGDWKGPEVILSNSDIVYPNEFQLLPSGIVVERVPVIPAKK